MKKIEAEQKAEQLNASLFAAPYYEDLAKVGCVGYTAEDCGCLGWQAGLTFRHNEEVIKAEKQGDAIMKEDEFMQLKAQCIKITQGMVRNFEDAENAIQLLCSLALQQSTIYSCVRRIKQRTEK